MKTYHKTDEPKKIVFIDTHCHIHDPEFYNKSNKKSVEILDDAQSLGVEKLICVGTSTKSSYQAVEFANQNEGVFASIAVHPHEAENYNHSQLHRQTEELDVLASTKSNKLIAIGECGLDYFYHNDQKVLDRQKDLFIKHLELSKKYNLPVIFHIRDPKNTLESEVGKAFQDFFQIVDSMNVKNGVIHSFSATKKELEGVLSRGFYVGLNGIMTFTNDEKQLEAAKCVPIDRLLLETDAPFLTPKPFRGTMCEPKHVVRVGEFLSELRSESLELLARKTSTNAQRLFKF